MRDVEKGTKSTPPPLSLLDAPLTLIKNLKTILSKVVSGANSYVSGEAMPPQARGKDYKLSNLSICNMQDLSSGKGECLILDISQKAKGLEVKSKDNIGILVIKKAHL